MARAIEFQKSGFNIKPPRWLGNVVKRAAGKIAEDYRHVNTGLKTVFDQISHPQSPAPNFERPNSDQSESQFRFRDPVAERVTKNAWQKSVEEHGFDELTLLMATIKRNLKLLDNKASIALFRHELSEISPLIGREIGSDLSSALEEFSYRPWGSMFENNPEIYERCLDTARFRREQLSQQRLEMINQRERQPIQEANDKFLAGKGPSGLAAMRMIRRAFGQEGKPSPTHWDKNELDAFILEIHNVMPLSSSPEPTESEIRKGFIEAYNQYKSDVHGWGEIIKQDSQTSKAA